MVDTVELKLTGAKELADKLRKLPGKLEKEVLQVSTLKALDDVLPEMIEAAPHHTDEQSPYSEKYGTIRQNLRVVKKKNVGRNQKGARLDTGKAAQAFWGEFGTRHQAAKPWFAPKIRQLAQTIIDKLGEDVGKFIELVWSASK